MEKAVVDRIEEAFVVLLVGETEREITVPVSELPDSIIEGAWVRVELEGDRVCRIDTDPTEIDKARTRIKQKLDRLRGRGRQE